VSYAQLAFDTLNLLLVRSKNLVTQHLIILNIPGKVRIIMMLDGCSWHLWKNKGKSELRAQFPSSQAHKKSIGFSGWKLPKTLIM
jgi:hypothetical protein